MKVIKVNYLFASSPSSPFSHPVSSPKLSNVAFSLLFKISHSILHYVWLFKFKHIYTHTYSHTVMSVLLCLCCGNLFCRMSLTSKKQDDPWYTSCLHTWYNTYKPTRAHAQLASNTQSSSHHTIANFQYLCHRWRAVNSNSVMPFPVSFSIL